MKVLFDSVKKEFLHTNSKIIVFEIQHYEATLPRSSSWKVWLLTSITFTDNPNQNS